MYVSYISKCCKCVLRYENTYLSRQFFSNCYPIDSLINDLGTLVPRNFSVYQKMVTFGKRY